jgi:hypothetical protein
VGGADLYTLGVVLADVLLTEVLRVLSSSSSEIGKEERRDRFFKGFNTVVSPRAESFCRFN